MVPPTVAVSDVSTIAQGLDISQQSWSSLELSGVLSPPPLSPPPPPLSPPPPPPAAAPQRQNARRMIKGKVQAEVQRGVSDFWKEKIGRYAMQGDYLALIMEEKGCVSWKSYMWDIPQGVLRFAINAGLNTLPTADNLRRWGKRVNDRCPLCGNTQTLLHVLSNCSVSLDQGRLTWRHNSVLLTLIESIQPLLHENFSLYSDLPGFTAAHGGVIPPHILVTSLRPDLFIINETSKQIIFFELTCPWDGNVARSHTYKEEKYTPLITDLSREYSVFNYSVEVSARGQVTKDNRARIKSLVWKCCRQPKGVDKNVTKLMSKAAILTSFTLFSARKEPAWSSPSPLIVRQF